MTIRTESMQREMKRAGILMLLLAPAMLAACAEEIFAPEADFDPTGLTATHEWVHHRWDQGQAVGQPSVELDWVLPRRWHPDHVFRVYGRRANTGWGLIATVTSCAAERCRYTDLNVAHGQRYEYYIVTLDERTGHEIGSSRAVSIDVPSRATVTAPTAIEAVALDGAVFLRWQATGAVNHLVLAQEDGGTLFLVGDTDGTSFLDDRAVNGTRYSYFVASVDAGGQVGSLSAGSSAIPRPDYHAEIIWAHADRPTHSGFRLVQSGQENPIVAGDATQAIFRVESVPGGLQIRPLGQTAITQGTFTTALTCGAGADPDCVSINVAPGDGSFGIAPVPVATGHTFVFRAPAAGGTRFGKVRVQGPTVDSQGRRAVVFDWAIQLVPGERSLGVEGG
jgi:hypothetical protein